MAEVATKKSIVVSKTKPDVCSVQSNNGLIDLDDITTSNNQLISLCENDDDLIITNNSKNELEDKSLQELIESELALRICSNDESTDENALTEEKKIEEIHDPPDINSQFLEAEIQHFCDSQEPYRNGHVAATVSKEEESVEEVDFSAAEDKREVEEEVVEESSRLEPEVNKFQSIDGKFTVEEFDEQVTSPEPKILVEDASPLDEQPTNEVNENWTDLTPPGDVLPAGQFSDNFISPCEETEVVSLKEEEPKEPFFGREEYSRSFEEEIASTEAFIEAERLLKAEEEAERNERREVTDDFVNTPKQKIIESEIEKKEEDETKSNVELFNEKVEEETISAGDDQPSNEIISEREINVEESDGKEESATLAETDRNFEEDFETNVDNNVETNQCVESDSSPVAPLATPDDDSSNISNTCDSESREETVTTTSSVVTSSSTTKGGAKTKKKKIEGVAGNDASPNLTPRTKKTKKSKKSDLEKENISVCRSFGDISNMSDNDQMAFGKSGQPVDSEKKSSFNKFDALSKKTVLHVRSVDSGKVQQQLNAVGQNGDTNPNCRSCNKVVFQMEQTKAEGLVWHKNCFRCVQCSKQLNVDNYESHESTLYCKAHFKELFQPKPVEESNQPVRPRKPELIIRENEPKELPPDVVRASDKPDLGLEELSSLNVKSRFQVFEKAGAETTNEIERSPSQVAVKRSPSILSKLAKFQAKGMDIGVADESLNGIPYEQSSESEEEVEEEETEEVDSEIIKAKRTTRERPISFTKMDDIKNRWESTSQQGRRETQREARKEEIAGIRSRLFMGKQGKMKEMYQQAVAESERITKINAAEEIQHSTNARSIKERFERGEPIATSDDETDSKPKPEKADEEVIAAGISRKSRSLFLELDATAAKSGRPVTPVNPKTPADVPRRARDMDSPDREIYRDPDVVRADDRVDEVVHTDTARKMLSIFRQMEEKATKEDVPEGPKPLKRFTPPPEDKFAKATASDSDEEEEEEGEESEGDDSAEERDPNYVRASDKVEDEFLKQAQNAARAKTLRAKFEHWEETDGKISNHHITEMDVAQGEQSSIESASTLRARFESLGSQGNETPRAPKVKVNRFVEIHTTCADLCESCQKRVYPLEKVETNNKIFHKQCFRCLQCNCVLRMDTFTLNNGKLYCIPHFKQLFITRGNYDEGFGVDPHKNKWANNANSNATPIVVSNGDL